MPYQSPDLATLPKAKIAEIGKIQNKGDYFFRTVTLSDGTSGEVWHRSKAKSEYLDKVFEGGEDIPYKTVQNKRDGVNITLYVSEDSFQSASAPKTDRQKEWEVKDAYYARLEEYKQKREAINDPKIEFQAHFAALAQVYSKVPVKDVAQAKAVGEALYEHAKEIFGRENPVKE